MIHLGSAPTRFLLFTILATFAISVLASGSEKDQFQDAVLVRSEAVRAGENCHTDGRATSEANGDGTIDTRGTASTDCSDVFRMRYTVRVGENTYVLVKGKSKKSSALGFATLGWSHAFERNSVLAYQIPGTHVLVRTDGDGFHVKLGKRESLFTVVAAQ